MRRSLVGFGLILMGAWPAAATPQGRFKVIVNTSVVGKVLPKNTLGDIFFKKVSRWGNGSIIQPVDLSLTSPVRLAFAEEVLGLSGEGLKVHWGRALTQGVIPPSVRKSEEDVVAFVGSTPGAIGYVSEETVVTERVRVVEVR